MEEPARGEQVSSSRPLPPPPEQDLLGLALTFRLARKGLEALPLVGLLTFVQSRKAAGGGDRKAGSAGESLGVGEGGRCCFLCKLSNAALGNKPSTGRL